MKRDTRTALKVVNGFVAMQDSQADAARQFGVSRQVLNQWLCDETRGFGPLTQRRIALILGLPYEAIDFKHTRICDLPCEKARGKG